MRIWGLRGPLGAFICAWGGVAMLASAPFDDWWHNAYGLDVRIISPPHMVLAAGFFGIEFGTVMLMLAFMNRASERLRPALERLFLYVGGTVLCESLLIKLESISRSDQHNARFYIVVFIGTPAILAALAIASRAQVGEHDHHRRLQRVRAGVPVDPAAVSRRAEAGPGVSPGHAFHSVGISAAADRAGVRDGSDPAAHDDLAAAGPRRWSSAWRSSRCSSRCSGRSRIS